MSERADRALQTVNQADDLARGKRGTQAPGHRAHPNSPRSWDAQGEAPPGWTAPHRVTENPKRPGEYMLVVRDRTVQRAIDSPDVTREDREDLESLYAAGSATRPADYAPDEP